MNFNNPALSNNFLRNRFALALAATANMNNNNNNNNNPQPLPSPILSTPVPTDTNLHARSIVIRPRPASLFSNSDSPLNLPFSLPATMPDNIDRLPQVHEKPRCPYTPAQRRRVESKLTGLSLAPKLNEVAKVATEVSERDQQEYNNENDDMVYFTITPVEDEKGRPAFGRYMQAFTIDSTRDRLSTKYTNDQILFKRFTDRRLRQSANMIEEYIQNSIDQYKALKELGTAVAEIINIDTVLKDGFYLVQKIPHKFKIEWTPSSEINQLTPQAQDLLYQVKTMLKIAYDNKIDADIRCENVRVDDNNKAFLIDFREDISEDKDCANPFALEVPICVSSFANGNEEIYDYLNPMQI